MSELAHVPVMLRECVELLNIRPGGVYVDMTLGLGGHAEAVCAALDAGRLIGFDKDGAALERAAVRLARFGDRFTAVRADYRRLAGELDRLGIPAVDGILCDMGVSSLQLDDAERGFSYRKDAALDMRMDRNAALTADEIVNAWPLAEVERILREYGEERYARRIAAAIGRARPIRGTLALGTVITDAMPAQARREAQHPARRSFQGIRMAVNDELGGVMQGIEAAVQALAPGGRLVALTFHSLEDRAVKRIFQAAASPCTCPPDFPVCICGRTPVVKAVGPQPCLPGEAEIRENPRAHSAKLRVVEKL